MATDFFGLFTRHLEIIPEPARDRESGASDEDPTMLLLVVLVLLAAFAMIVVLVRRDPAKWYGEMVCPGFAYRWTSRRSTAPARCPACGKRGVHPVTVDEPTP